MRRRLSNNITNTYLYNSGKASAANNMNAFVSRIINNDSRTKNDITRIWSLARNDKELTYEGLEEYIDKLASELDASQKLNFVRWPIMNEWVHQNPVLSGSYAGEVRRVKNYLKGRFPILDRLMKYDSTITGIKDTEITEGKLTPIVNGKTISLGDDVTFDVYTADGRKVFSGTGSTPALPSGIYIVKAQAGVAKIML